MISMKTIMKMVTNSFQKNADDWRIVRVAAEFIAYITLIMTVHAAPIDLDSSAGSVTIFVIEAGLLTMVCRLMVAAWFRPWSERDGVRFARGGLSLTAAALCFCLGGWSGAYSGDTYGLLMPAFASYLLLSGLASLVSPVKRITQRRETRKAQHNEKLAELRRTLEERA